MVQPSRDCVAEALEEALGCGYEHLECDKQLCIQNVIGLLRTFTFEISMGKQAMEDVIYRRAGNCLGLACLMCSMLRRAGFAPHESLVMIASLSGGSLHRIHALTVVKQTPGVVLVIDPETMSSAGLTPEALASRYSVLAVFNDSVLGFSMEEKRKLLEPASSW